MELVYHLLLLALGFAGLSIGSDLLVQQACVLADRLKIQPLIVGLFLLGMATSLPEWAVSVWSSIQDLPALAVGNVIGSNIFNILIVLSLILLNPLSPISYQAIKKDLWFLGITGIGLFILLLDHLISFGEALLLIGIFGLYVFISCRAYQDSSPSPPPSSSLQEPSLSKLKLTALGLVGFIFLTGGSYITVYSAEHLLPIFGLSERVIGIVLVSVGTSLPELFVCLQTLLKNQKNMALGNIIGSNVFNSFAVLGSAGLIKALALDPKTSTIDMPLLLGAYLLLLLSLRFLQQKYYRVGLAGFFLISYTLYLTYLLSIK